MNNTYQGTIDRLYLVAGPSACGKSTFLDNIDLSLESIYLPGSQDGLIAIASSHLPVTRLVDSGTEHYDHLCIHVDITNPLRQKTVIPDSRKGFLEVLNRDLYTNWARLCSYIACAKELHIITLVIDREILFKRWIAMHLSRSSRRFVALNIVSMMGDSENNSELHRQLYCGWFEFIQGYNPDFTHAVNVNSKPYRTVQERELQDFLAGTRTLS